MNDIDALGKISQADKRYTKQYVLALIMVGIIGFAGNFIFASSISGQAAMGQAINVSGKQRMLSQRGAFLVNELLIVEEEGRANIRRNLHELIDEMRSSHQDLIFGNEALGIPALPSTVVWEIFMTAPDSLNERTHQYLAELESVLNTPDDGFMISNQDLYKINHGDAESLLVLFDKVANQFQLENNQAIDRLVLLQNLSLVILVSTLLVIGFGIFRPMIIAVKIRSKDLLDNQKRLQAVIDSAVDALISTTVDGYVISFNPAAEKMFGYNSSEIIGHKFSTLMTVQDELWDEDVENQDGTAQNDSGLFGKSKTGRTFPIQVGLNEVNLPTGEGMYFGIVRDITAIKEQEKNREHMMEELQQTNEELERFTYTVSHDLKSPLVTICGFVGLLEKDIEKQNNEGVKKSLNFIKTATITMQTLLNDLLELSRIGFKRGERIQLRFNDMLGGVLESLTEQIKVKQATIEIEENMPLVEVEKIRFDELFLNLIENALKYMEDQTAPFVKVGYKVVENSDGAQETVFFVKDNGRGLKPQYCKQVFELFERVALDVEGTGVGLAIVKRIVETHGGRIWVESDGPGYGATFYFVIPTVESVQQLESVA